MCITNNALFNWINSWNQLEQANEKSFHDTATKSNQLLVSLSASCLHVHVRGYNITFNRASGTGMF